MSALNFVEDFMMGSHNFNFGCTIEPTNNNNNDINHASTKNEILSNNPADCLAPWVLLNG